MQANSTASGEDESQAYTLVFGQLVEDVIGALEMDVHAIEDPEHASAVLLLVEQFSQAPIVPPWEVCIVKTPTGPPLVQYVDSITGEVAATHPGLEYLVELIREKDSQHRQQQQQHAQSLKSRTSTLSSRPTTSNSKRAMAAPATLEFMSWWKELSIEGVPITHTLVLSHDLQTGCFRVRIDDSSLELEVDKLDGKYGIVEPIDLFVGATIMLFGKRVTLMKASSATVRWVEDQAEQMNKMIHELRDQLYLFGIDPVRVPYRPRLENRGPGSSNLRLLRREVDMLQDQLATATRPPPQQGQRSFFLTT